MIYYYAILQMYLFFLQINGKIFVCFKLYVRVLILKFMCVIEFVCI